MIQLKEYAKQIQYSNIGRNCISLTQLQIYPASEYRGQSNILSDAGCGSRVMSVRDIIRFTMTWQSVHIQIQIRLSGQRGLNRTNNKFSIPVCYTYPTDSGCTERLSVIPQHSRLYGCRRKAKPQSCITVTLRFNMFPLLGGTEHKDP